MPNSSSAKFLQPLDRVALIIIVILALLTGILLWSGDRTTAKVKNFSWENQQIGAEDTAFILTFSRPMDHASVEANLRLEPSLPGRISWAGRRMAYTLNAPAPYGEIYQVQLQGAHDYFKGGKHAPNQPFVGHFRSRDRAFAYIGVEGEERGRLIIYNFTQQQKQILTPPTLTVMDFKAYPEGDRILFSAIESTASKPTQVSSQLRQQLYTVTTGLRTQPSPNSADPAAKSLTAPVPPGKVNLLLDSRDYQNLKFDLSPDGQTILVQRVNWQKPGDARLWKLSSAAGTQPIPLGDSTSGNFLIAPDSKSLVIAQGQGVALLPLDPASKPLDFLPKFGTVLSFARDGTQAAMVKFNTDYTRSLFIVTNQGVQKEIFRTTGSILNAQFSPSNQTLYCLLTELIPGAEYQEQPYLGAINLKAAIGGTSSQNPSQGTMKPLLLLPQQRDIQMSLSPDGLALLFDQTSTDNKPTTTTSQGLWNDEGKTIATSKLWLLPLVTDLTAQSKIQAEELLPGLRPRWLP